MFPGFFDVSKLRLTLAELRSATCSLEAVLLAFLHARIAGEKTGLLERGAELGVDEKQGAGDAVAQGASLTGDAAALDGGNDVDLAELLGGDQRLTDDHLQGLA